MRFGFCLSFFGRIVSLLGFSRTLPIASTLPDVERSCPPPMVGCGMDGTVSVSTVMLFNGTSARDFTVESEEYDAFDVMFGRCEDEDRLTGDFSLRSFLFAPLSLPLSVCLGALVLRSSVTLAVVMSSSLANRVG